MIDFFQSITPIYLIFLLYGAAFLLLGVSIAVKDMQGSDLPLANSLWMLSAFGFIHGAHEWNQLGLLIEGANLEFEQIFWMKAFSTGLVIISFLFLLMFGISLVSVLHKRRYRWVKFLPIPLFIVFVLHTGYFGLYKEGFDFHMQTLRQANLASRYTFGFVGGLITAYGLILNARELTSLSRPVAQKLVYAGVTFSLYAVFAGLFQAWYKVPFLDLPVAVIRTVLAIFLTYFITKALNIFNIEMRMKYDQQAKSIIQAEKLTSLGRLAAGIAHEINNPLTSASLGLQTLKSRALKNSGAHSDIVERLEAVERNIDKASTIASELLQFSRQKTSAFAMMDVHDAIKGAITLMQYRLKGFNVVKDFEQVPEIQGDHGKLEQVFINVLANALEAMPDGGEVFIKTVQSNGSVIIRIADTGTGISQENLVKVFDPFFTTKEVGKGTGLGLAISYGIIRQHHGSIEIANRPDGSGTVVKITLPAGGWNE